MPNLSGVAKATQTEQQSGFFEGAVPPRGAYLQVLAAYPGLSEDANGDGVYDDGVVWDSNSDGTPENHFIQDPLIVDLDSHGFAPGDRMMIGFKQSMFSTTHSAFAYIMFGLFSSTNQLLSDHWVYDSPNDSMNWPIIGPLHRVPGAIDVALGGYVHKPSDNTDLYYKQGQEVVTDIPEDFCLSGPVGGWNQGSNGVPWTSETWWYSNCLWVTVPPNAHYLFVAAVSQWMIGTDGTCTITLDKDADNDGIPGSWERNAIDINKDGFYDLALPDASDLHKDIYVEVDYMPGCELRPGVIDSVKKAFANAPVGNPDNKYGINIHTLVDEQIAGAAWTRVWDDFDNAKSIYFGTAVDRTSPDRTAILEARMQVSHYCLFINQIAFWNDYTSLWERDNSSGYAELPGNDFMVALGDIGGGDRMEQASTFMHELGHNLGLHHGGRDDINFKPNYLSIMNYMFQFNYFLPERPMDYSWIELDPLNEKNLDETKGLGVDYVSTGSSGWLLTGHKDPVKNKTVLSLLRPIDWNGDHQYNVSVQANINNCTDRHYESEPNELLSGSNDWENIILAFQNLPTLAANAHGESPEEITTDVMMAMKESAMNYHEIALINATLSSDILFTDTTLDVTVHSINFGANNETSNLSVFAGARLIAYKTIALERCNITTTVLRCDLSNLSNGSQLISIRLGQVQGETETTDNNYTYGMVEFSGEASPQGAGLSWPLILGLSAVAVAAVAIALFFFWRRGKKDV